MKLCINYTLMGLCLAALSGPLSGRAATIWNGPLISFTQASPYPGAGDRDQLTPHVALTRATPVGGGTGGMFNAVTETAFTKFVSPADTEWAVGSLANYSTLTYSDWTTAGGGNPVHNYPGEQLVVHLKSDDIYLSLVFTSLPAGPGFSYNRSTPTPADVPPAVAITSPTNGASFTAPAIVPITATANDSDGSVTNVTFFDGATFLGGTNNTPYTVTATFAAGTHSLTAVATDNGGLSTTSAVVTVSVSVANSPPSVTITNPPDNSVFGNTDSVTFRADASDSDGTVTNVQYFDGTVSLGNRTTSPYTVTTGPFTFALGLHTLTAIATDNLGATGTSAPIHLTIARYTPAITNGNISLLLLPVATNMAAPDYGISPPGDTHRLFVVEQNGLLRIIQDGTLLPTPALDIQSRVQPPLVASNPNDERGFLGLAFHPGFTNPASPGYQTLYTYNSEMIPTNTTPTYVVPNGATNNYKNVVNEWKVSSTNANIVDPTTRREVISFGKNAGNHNGGTITFGPDGYVYLALGDGGNANDVGASHIVPGGNAQNLSTPLGKMLRFDPLIPALNPTSPDPISANGQYRIPTNNPFQSPGQVPEIYCYGLRNPYRFAFDPVTGDLIEADVGQNNIEEINRIVRAGNFGWAVKEGDFLFNMTNGPAGPAGTIGAPPGYFSSGSPAGLIDPITGPKGILEYDHNNGISITGGFVYRGAGMPELYGKYIFGDLALVASPVRINGRLFYADLQTGEMHVFTLPQFGSEILPAGQTVHGFGQDANGELYAMATDTPPNGNGGVVYKLLSVRLAAQVVSNQLYISWPIAGGRLQTQTNAPGVGLGTNWVTLPGSTMTNHVVVPIDPANGSVFYRLAMP
ncbi:MAG TPA: PQQ-dependent sugar dehydrogenase [Candidatus Binatia bacterium]|nr:PQQ-dependent sugar dehydrogenase [Candidatus Binatia bacterium]